VLAKELVEVQKEVLRKNGKPLKKVFKKKGSENLEPFFYVKDSKA